MDIILQIKIAKEFNKLLTKYRALFCSNEVPNSASGQYSYCLRSKRDGTPVKVGVLEAAGLINIFNGYEIAESADGQYYLCTNQPTHSINEQAIYLQALNNAAL